MTCEQFQGAYQTLVDFQKTDELTPEMKGHMLGCPSCALFASSMKSVDRVLREQPKPELPPGLAATLNAIPVQAMKDELRPKRLAKKLAVILGGGMGVTLIGIAALPSDLLPLGGMILVVAGIVILLHEALRPGHEFISLE